jgi:hypothetical protein
MKKITLLCPLLVLVGCGGENTDQGRKEVLVLSGGDSPIIITDGSMHFKKKNLAQADLDTGKNQATFQVPKDALFAVTVWGCTDQKHQSTCRVDPKQTQTLLEPGTTATPATLWTLTIYHKDGHPAATLVFDSKTPKFIQLAPRPGETLLYESSLPDDYDGVFIPPPDGFSLKNLNVFKAGVSIKSGKETPITCPKGLSCRIQIERVED